MLKTDTTYNNSLLLNDLGCSSLEVSTPHLEFEIELESNNLVYEQRYKPRQEVIYQIIRILHQEQGLGYRKISKKLNDWGIKTERGNTWFPQSVFSVLKRRKQRDNRIEKQRLKTFEPKVSKLSIKYHP
jgi:hypothetical protein